MLKDSQTLSKYSDKYKIYSTLIQAPKLKLYGVADSYLKKNPKDACVDLFHKRTTKALRPSFAVITNYCCLLT